MRKITAVAAISHLMRGVQLLFRCPTRKILVRRIIVHPRSSVVTNVETACTVRGDREMFPMRSATPIPVR